MRFEDINKILKGANKLHKMKLYARKTTGDNVVIWIYHNYERKSLKFPSLSLTYDRSIKAKEIELLKKAIEHRDELERQTGYAFASVLDRKIKVSKVLQEWIAHYAVKSSARNSRLAAAKFLETNGDIPAGTVSRKHFIKMIDTMKLNGSNANYIRCISSRFRAFCNWAEQRGYMERIDTIGLLPCRPAIS